MSKTTAFGRATSATLLLLIIGCAGHGDVPELANVEGRITLDGDPLPDVFVNFIPESGRGSVGYTDQNGKYKATYMNNVMGARIGKQKISIDFPIDDDSPREAAKSKPKIPAKYNVQTTLTVDIKPGKNVCDFDLTSE